MNMRTSSTRPPSCMYCLGELSRMVGTPANMLFPSERDSAKSSSKPPPRARFLQKDRNDRKKNHPSLLQFTLIYRFKVLSDNFSSVRICMLVRSDLLCTSRCVSALDFTAETAALYTTIYTSLCRHVWPARSPAPTAQAQLLSICYSTNLVVLKLFCTSSLATYAKVVQRLLWENRTTVLLKVTHWQGCSKPRVSFLCCPCPPLREGWKGNRQPSLRIWQESLCLRTLSCLREGVKTF